MFSLGMRQSDKTISPVCEARIDIFRRMEGVSKPGVPRSTRKPRTLCRSSVASLAHTTATSHTGELVIHILVPLST